MGWFGKKKPDAKPKVIWHVPEGTENFLVPKRATPGAMAFDLVSPTETVVGSAGHGGAGRALVNTLVAVTLPPGYAMILGSRSGLAAKHGLTVEAGWIDNDYRGMIRVVLYNHSASDYVIKAGERIAQAMLVRIPDVDSVIEWTYPDPSETQRGTGGFGSTGK